MSVAVSGRTCTTVDFGTRRRRSRCLDRHHRSGDLRLAHLRFDPSVAADRLWDLLLSEEDRLADARRRGCRLVGAMKDLGTVPVMACALPNLVAFYPDGAWWTPCLMERTDGLLRLADRHGIHAGFCPVRAMLGAFDNGAHFPSPDLLTCSVGAVCDDFSAIAQRVEAMGHPILWWEMPVRRDPDADEEAILLPGGAAAPRSQRDLVQAELERVRHALARLAETELTDERLAAGIRAANSIRRCLAALRHAVFTAARPPLPDLELLIAEMLAIHFCSDRAAAEAVLASLLRLVRRRIRSGAGFGTDSAVRVFWVNPVADLAAMQLLGETGGRLCGTDLLFLHAIDPIPRDVPPMEALAATALADPMAGSSRSRANRIVREMRRLGSEALVVSRIPGASHCGHEGAVLAATVREALDVPCLEIEVPSVSDPLDASLRTRLEALVETCRSRRT